MRKFSNTKISTMKKRCDLITAECIEDKKKFGITLQEPDITAILVKELTIRLNKYFNRRKCNCKFGGCFVHQSPRVHFVDSKGKKGSCEAGDLLVLCRKIVDGVEQFNATLFQLKMLPIHGINKRQLELYQKWPLFEIKSFAKYNIYPKAITPGGQYLFVSIDSPNRHALYSAIPSKKEDLSLYNTWGEFLLDFIRWQTGRPISPESSAVKDDWSRFIWDLIGNSRIKVFNRTPAGYTKVPRTNGDFFCMMTMRDNDQILFEDNYGGNNYITTMNNNEQDDFGAISILFIDIDEDESERINI